MTGGGCAVGDWLRVMTGVMTCGGCRVGDWLHVMTGVTGGRWAPYHWSRPVTRPGARCPRCAKAHVRVDTSKDLNPLM